jgi:hypothetical protein
MATSGPNAVFFTGAAFESSTVAGTVLAVAFGVVGGRRPAT